MTKTTKPTTRSVYMPKNVYKYSESGWRLTPPSDEYIEAMGNELLDWALELKEPKSIMRFFRERGHAQTAIDRWKERSEPFKRAFEEAKAIMLDLIHDNSINNKANFNAVKFYLPSYHEKYKELHRFHASLKEEAKGNDDRNITIVMQNYGEPEKEQSNETTSHENDVPPVQEGNKDER